MAGDCSSKAALRARLGSSAPWIAGIVNLTPDSFSDGGQIPNQQAARECIEKLRTDGAQIIDIGGESTGPGRKPVSSAAELARIEDAVGEAAKKCFVSVDTFKARTAQRCIELGAQMINDVSALRFDPEMPQLIAESGAFIVIMFSKEDDASPHATLRAQTYQDVVEHISRFLEERVEYALRCGIRKEQIILDPGMGAFVSTLPGYSWEILRRFGELRRRFADFALLVGTSRKSFLGGELNARDPLSQLTGLAAHLEGADIIRTHNPAMAREFFCAWRKL